MLALLREVGNLKLSTKILTRGFNLYPNSPGIVNNYINLLREKGDISLLVQVAHVGILSTIPQILRLDAHFLRH